jgi:hypothetical protein
MVGEQQISGIGIGTRDHHGRHIEHVGRETRRHQLVDALLGRDQHLAAEVAALLGGGQLVLEMHAGGAGADQRLGQLKGVQIAAEAGFGIGDDRHQPVDIFLAFHVMDLIRAQQGVVDALDHFGHRVDRVQTLVRVHLSGGVRIARHLPTRAIDRLKSGLHRLDRLVSGHAA